MGVGSLHVELDYAKGFGQSDLVAC